MPYCIHEFNPKPLQTFFFSHCLLCKKSLRHKPCGSVTKQQRGPPASWIAIRAGLLYDR